MAYKRNYTKPARQLLNSTIKNYHFNLQHKKKKTYNTNCLIAIAVITR